MVLNNLFQEEDINPQNVSKLMDYFSRMRRDEYEILNRPFASCEVRGALMSMDADKAHGPDGFQPLFYSKFWDTTSLSLIQSMKDVLEGATFSEGLDNAFLVLIPKCDLPKSANHFRLIGLCNIVH